MQRARACRGPSRGSGPPKWCRCVSAASRSRSTPSTTRYPAASKPKAKPASPTEQVQPRDDNHPARRRAAYSRKSSSPHSSGCRRKLNEWPPDQLDAVLPALDHPQVRPPPCGPPVPSQRQGNDHHRQNDSTAYAASATSCVTRPDRLSGLAIGSTWHDGRPVAATALKTWLH